MEGALYDIAEEFPFGQRRFLVSTRIVGGEKLAVYVVEGDAPPSYANTTHFPRSEGLSPGDGDELRL